MKVVLDASAAIAALEHDAVLVTSDHALLDQSIPRLRAEDWLHSG